jgi:TonB family protein
MGRAVVGLALGAAVQLAAAAGAVAQDRPVNWIHRPDPEQIFALTPAEALRRGVGGGVDLVCTVTVDGVLADCTTVAENPPDVGFGHAALSMAPQFRLRPAMHDGRPVATQVRIPFRWSEPQRPVGSLLAQGPLPMLTERTVTSVAWAAAPSLAELAAAYPQDARRAGASGAAALRCLIAADGRLRDCDIMNEEPLSGGFGTAARRLIDRFRAPVDGHPDLAGAHTQIRFTFTPRLLDNPTTLQGPPSWTATPSGNEPGAGFPRAAAQAGVLDARVQVDCTVGRDGRLTDCTVANETSPGYGFGQAAIALAGGFTMSLWTEEGLPTAGARLRVPLHYTLPTPPVAASGH